jgi:hypothetical protein
MMKCKECKSEIQFKWNKGTNELLRINQLCFNCQFWWEKIAQADKLIRVDGHCYRIPKPTVHEIFKGFGGAKFKIKFKDGRVIETDNLWHNGEIPAHFRDRLPDNAEFVKEPGYGRGF